MHELYSWRWSEDGPSIPSCLFLVLQLTPLAGAACRKVPGLAPLPPLPLGPTTDAAKCCDQVAPLSSRRTRKARPHCRGSRLPHGTCRGRSRLCLPGQRRAAGRDRLRPNRRGLQGAELAGRPPAPHASRLATCRARKGKVWLPPLGLNFPALRCKSPPFPRRQSPRAPAFRALQRDYLLWRLPQRRSLRSGHLELPDSSAAVAAAARTVEVSGSRGRGSRAVAHVLTA